MKKLEPVVIEIRGGVVAGWHLPVGVRVEVRDYDCVECPKTGHFHRMRLGHWK